MLAGGQRHTWRDLATRVEARLAAWKTLPALPLSFVAAIDLESIVTILAALESSRPIVPLHPALAEPERDRIRALAGPVVQLDSAMIAPLAPDKLDSAMIAPSAAEKLDSAMIANRELESAEIAAVVFTSGTTGTPKGALLPRDALLMAALASAANLPLTPDDRWLLALPLAHVGGLSIVVRSLVARSAMVLADRFSPDVVRRDAATIVSLVPAQLSRWMDEDARPLPSSLRAVLLGGSGASPGLLARAAERGIPVLCTWGMTETCAQAVTWAPGTPVSSAEGSGRPLQGIELRIAEGGRILVRGPSLFTGYLGLPSPFDAEGWFDTGDLGRVDAEGRLHVEARRTDLIVTGGENVYPAEVEQVLETCPGVAAVCVVGLPDEKWGQIVCAAVVPSTDSPADADDLRRFAADRLASFKRPRRVVLLEALPRNPLKVHRAEVIRLCLAAQQVNK